MCYTHFLYSSFVLVNYTPNNTGLLQIYLESYNSKGRQKSIGFLLAQSKRVQTEGRPVCMSAEHLQREVLEIVRGFWAGAQGRRAAGKEGKQIV